MAARPRVGGCPKIGYNSFDELGSFTNFHLPRKQTTCYWPEPMPCTQLTTDRWRLTNTQSWNRCSYVNNSPILYNDPSGYHYCLWDGENCEEDYDAHLVAPDTDWEPGTAQYGGGGPDPWCPDTGQCSMIKDEDIAFILSLLPGLETYDDVTTFLTGCGIECQAGFEEETGWGWRLAAGVFIFLPVSGKVAGGLTEGASDLARKLCSFDAETLVMTDEGLVNISEIEVGDYVLAFNEETGETDYYQVTAVWAHEDEEITYLIINGELIITTPDHPFYTSEGEWVAVADLAVGDEVIQAHGDYSVVESNTTITQTEWMYNLTVDTAHTYFVGDGQWLVHNACPWADMSEKSLERALRSLQQRLDEHSTKLDNYIANPLAYDDGRLIEALAAGDMDRYNRIIQERIRHLRQEISNWQNDIRDILAALGK